VLGINQPRISDLLRGKISQFSIDQLIKMRERIHINVALVIDDRLVALILPWHFFVHPKNSIKRNYK
jgi:hypothetical protein